MILLYVVEHYASGSLSQGEAQPRSTVGARWVESFGKNWKNRSKEPITPRTDGLWALPREKERLVISPTFADFPLNVDVRSIRIPLELKQLPGNSNSMSVNPVFVFVPGAWHTADSFDVVRDLMHNRGLATEAISTPSVGAFPPDKGLHADIEHTHAVLKEMVEAGCQIVLVNHSYGGMVGAGAVKGLGYTERRKAGLPGGVIMVVWMAAFVTPKGKTLMDMLGGKHAPWMVINVSGSSSFGFLLLYPTDGPCRARMTDTAGPLTKRQYSITTCLLKRSRRPFPN
jgi:hypothetical protein